MHSVTTGLILRETTYKEADKILTVLTPEGKRTVRSRGCRRKGSKLAAASQLLVYSELTLFSYKDFDSLSEASSLNQFRTLRGDMEKLALASYFAQTMECVAVEGRGDPELLSLILNSLYALDQLDRPLPLVKAAYELKLMELCGYAPLVEGCALCGATAPSPCYFHLGEGAILCHNCHSGGGIPLSSATRAAMEHILQGNPKKLFSFSLDEASLATLGQICQQFLLSQLERGFSTLDFYRGLLGHGPM